MDEYKGEDAVKNTKEAAYNLSKMIESAKLKTPAADKTLVFNLIRLENPGVSAREGSLDDLRNSPGIMQHYADLIQAAQSGTLTDEKRNDLVRSATASYQGSRQIHQQIQQKYAGLAKENGISPTFLKEPSLDYTDKLAQGFMKSTKPYQQPSIFDVAKKAVGMGGPANAQAEAPPKLSPEDRTALQNALKKNPNDKRAPQIRALLQGG